MEDKDLSCLRELVRDCIEKHCYRSAIFFGDKACLLSNETSSDVYQLCQAYFYSGQHRRALLRLTRHQQAKRKEGKGNGSGSGDGRDGRGEREEREEREAFKYLMAKCLAECKEWERCLQVLDEKTDEGEGDECGQGGGGGGRGGPNGYRAGERNVAVSLFSNRGDASSGDEDEDPAGTGSRNAVAGDKTKLELESAMCVIRAKCYESMDNRDRAKHFYRRALEHSDPFCFEALEALVGNHMLSSKEEAALFDNLNLQGSDHEWLKLLYECKGKKYGRIEQIQSKLKTLEATGGPSSGTAAHKNGAMASDGRHPFGGELRHAFADPDDPPHHAHQSTVPAKVGKTLGQSLDVLTCKAEFLYHCCEYRQCYQVTTQVLEEDPYFLDCLPVHLACAVELNMKNDLFLLGHKLVEDHPNKAVSWFAVGCYYMCIRQFDSAERYFQKSTNIEKDFAPAWMGYGHAFACQDESDQAMAAYRTAARLFIGLHLPLVCLGIEYMRTNSLSLAEEFLNKAKSIAPDDPFVYNELGVLAFQRKQYGLAAKHFKKALSLIPNPYSNVTWEATVSNLAHALRKTNRYDEAIDVYTKALALKPRQANTYAAIAFTYQLMGQPHKAIELYHKSLSIEDDAFTSDMLFVALKEVSHPEMMMM